MGNQKQSVGRPKSFDENEVLLLAMNHFWEYGYNNSTLDSLLGVMGIKKSSFYSTFKSKEKLFSLSLELHRQEMSKQLADLEKAFGPRETMLMIANMTLDELKNTGKIKGCLLVNSGQECYQKYSSLSYQLSAEQVFIMNQLTGFIDRAKSLGEIQSKKDSKKIAGRYLSTLNGLFVTIRAGLEDEIVDDILKSLEEILQ